MLLLILNQFASDKIESSNFLRFKKTRRIRLSGFTVFQLCDPERIMPL